MVSELNEVRVRQYLRFHEAELPSRVPCVLVSPFMPGQVFRVPVSVSQSGNDDGA